MTPMVVLPARYERRDGQLVVVEPAQPCPELLTEEEAARYLRLDTMDLKDPGETLERYRALGLLRGTQISRRVFYRRVELDLFLERQTQANPR